MNLILPVRIDLQLLERQLNEAGMRVVTAWVHSLSEGQKVKVLEGGAS